MIRTEDTEICREIIDEVSGRKKRSTWNKWFGKMKQGSERGMVLTLI